jgi:two-component system chemotaxis sensor kinase CheA
MSKNDSPIVHEFLIESFENLSGISEELTHYEKDPSDKELLNSIYRKVHTLKGSASFIGFKKLQDITHAAENMLDLVREEKIKISANIIDVLLESFDCCMELLKAVEANGEENDKDYSGMVLKLVAVLEKEVTGDEQISGEGSTIVDEVPESNSVNIIETKVEATAKVESAPQSYKEVEENLLGSFEKEFSQEAKEEKNIEPTSEVKVEAPKPTPQVEEKIEVPPVDTMPKKGLTDSVVRVNVQLLDKIMNVVGELVLNRNQILQYANIYDSSELNRLAQQLNTITTELQTDIMTTRMQPVGSVLGKFERIVRDLSRSQNKKIKLIINGKDTELDKTLLEAIRDPMTHLIRNSVDHGVETPEERKSKGKSEEGHILIKAYHEGGQVTIEIQDDGNGVDPQKVLNKAIEKGLLSSERAQQLSERQILNLIFAPGFSTAEQVTNISGRGVGMDVVKSNIEKIGGAVDVTSALGSGTTFKLKIPLTLAIVPALVVQTHGETFAIPQINLVELVRLDIEDQDKLEKLHDSEFFRLRGELIPIFRLNDSLDLDAVNGRNGINKSSDDEDDKIDEKQSDSINIVILSAEGRVFGLIVDSVLDTEEIVVKPLSRKLRDLNVFAGATIMGDGRVSLIIDALGFFNEVDAGQSQRSDSFDMAGGEQIKLLDESQEVLLCELGDKRSYGIPLCLVNRLEEFKGKDIEWTGEQPLIRYGDVPMPLINLEQTIRLSGSSALATVNEDKEKIVPCVVVNLRGHFFGMVVNEIKDIAISEGDINDDTVDREGILGTAFINDKTVSLIDVHGVLDQKNIGKRSSLSTQGTMGKLLLIDDSPLFRKIQKEILIESGYEVTLASDGVEGLELIKSIGDFDVILTDVEMPNMNGTELTKNIRSSKAPYSDVPIVALSARVSKKSRLQGEEAGFNKHVEKMKQDQILDAVKDVLSA